MSEPRRVYFDTVFADDTSAMSIARDAETGEVLAVGVDVARPKGGVGQGLGTGLPNDVDYCDAELRALAFLNAEPVHAWGCSDCPEYHEDGIPCQTCGAPVDSEEK